MEKLEDASGLRTKIVAQYIEVRPTETQNVDAHLPPAVAERCPRLAPIAQLPVEAVKE